MPRPVPVPRPTAPAPRAVPEVQVVPAEPGSALDRADEAVDLLLDAGRGPGQVLVLTTGGAHPWQQHEESFGGDGYWAQLAAGDDVFYADAGADACRRVRREVVVLAVNGGPAAQVGQALAVALAAATLLVVVCGDPASIPGLPG